MSLPNYLAKIKSAGIYRFVWDKSQMPPQQADTLRLVVGYSEKGPFNTPVYIDNSTDFVKIFGNISKKLEKRGVYFHRNALQALKAGPILALNLKKFAYEVNEEENIYYDTVAYTALNPVSVSEKLKGITRIENVYNTARFWSLDPDGLPTKVLTAADKLSKNRYVTIVAADSKETSCTIIMRGAAAKSYDVTIKSWYANAGIEMPEYFEGYEDMLVSDFFAEVYVFRGKFNAAIASTEELKRYFDVNGDNVTLKPYLEDAFGNTIDTLDTLAADINSGFVQKYQGVTLPYFKDVNGAYMSIDLLFNGDNDIHKMLMKFDDTLLDNGDITVMDLTTRGWDHASDTGFFIGSNLISASDVPYDVALATIESSSEDSNSETMVGDIITYDFESRGPKTPHGSVFTRYELPDSYVEVVEDSLVINIPAAAGFGLAEGDRFLVTNNDNESRVATLSKYEVLYDDNTGDVTGIKLSFANTPAGDAKVAYDSKSWLVKCEHTMGDLIGKIYVSDLYMEGYTLSPSMIKPTNSNMMAKLNWQNAILSVLKEPGLFEALTNNTDVEYRLLVDTFESYVDENLKSTLSYLVRKKDNALGLLNFPAVSTFVNCDYSHFTDAEGFKMKYVVEGGNKRKANAKVFSLPLDTDGASWVAFYTPVMLTDGTVKTAVPSAALVSNLFMEKYRTGHAYDIVAGPNRGRILETGLVGPDYNYSRADLDLLEPFGVNCLVYVPRRGTLINSNQTAKQTPKSALSSVNVRELVIYLQDEIAYLLQSYQWELNTQPLRDTVKAKADTILTNVQNNGGVYDFENVCDKSNNTDEVIDNEMFVLGTSIEPARGAGKMVEELTIYRKGGMRSSAI